ncbi:wall-associated receptor kinase 3-like isoform X1 [Triticum urartu]|uniref:Wall-associated receptor kinase 5 n=1 Tax=Triticum urartu TaxID=4572 RepID=A0A8R7PLL5_TRIUA|nr:wall-associated receptor kinase 3-like isoform X1 [Triticum urartu]XP_048559800.1 wall-associated receptor kinase 3-like isoform X1 [Triticum urartu]
MQALLQLGLCLILLATQYAPAGSAVPSSHCRRQCGNVEIPYPFGIDPGCSLGDGFHLDCKVHDGIERPFRSVFEVLDISLKQGTTRVLNFIVGYCYNTSTRSMEYFGRYGGLNEGVSSPYRLSDVQNRFMVIGCNALASISDRDGTGYEGYGAAACRNQSDLVDGSCSGIGCSQTTIPKRMYFYATTFFSTVNNSQIWKFNRCSYAVLMETASFRFSTKYITTNKFNGTNDGRVPVVLDWAVRDIKSCDVAKQNKTGTYACLSSNSKCVNSSNDQGYMCNCTNGYEGNPYLPGGCKDINECDHNPCPSDGVCRNIAGEYRCSCRVGKKYAKESNTCNPNAGFIIGLTMGLFGLMVIIMISVFWGQMTIQKRKLNKVKQEYFREHGGLLLFDRMRSEKGLSFNVFSEAELRHATDNFDISRILGKGGHGTVYKGIIKSSTPVAVKRCGIVDERQKKEFGKEMLILSQINHKNVVKLLGCCLEVEVPILVYEFVRNGTLFELIHGKNQALQISFSTLLRIAHEAAEGLSFLHSYASPPIIHGDVKTSNILLDDNYMAKVSDFGASILAPSDKEQFVTMVQGTCGYLDPEYMQTCQLTDKSDVYSFGVILLEILTGQLPLKLEGTEKPRSLSLIFLSAMRENNLEDVLVSQVKGQASMELLRGLADLAKKCLEMCGDNRPSMKDVADELNRLRKLSLHPWVQLEMEMDEENLLGGESTSGYEIELSGYPMDQSENHPINPGSSYYAR